MNTSRALRRRSLRPVVVAGATWTAAAAATALTDPGLLAVCLSAAAAIVVALLVRVRHPLLVVVAVALACAGASAATVSSLVPTREAVAHLQVEGGRHLRVTATVTGHLARSSGGGAWMDASVSTLTAGATAVSGLIPARIGFDPEVLSDVASVGPGSEIVVAGTGIPTDPADRAILALRANEVERASAPEGVWAVFEQLRDGLVASTHGLPQPGAGLIPGLAVGDTSSLDSDTEIAMNAASLSHLTAVSGANCALVVGPPSVCSGCAGFVVASGWWAHSSCWQRSSSWSRPSPASSAPPR